MADWIKCEDELPENDLVVMTKILDGKCQRNEQKLRRKGALWFYPNNHMYVYYTPTHWKLI